jgi:hypothetical protein
MKLGDPNGMEAGGLVVGKFLSIVVSHAARYGMAGGWDLTDDQTNRPIACSLFIPSWNRLKSVLDPHELTRQTRTWFDSTRMPAQSMALWAR